MNEQDLIRLYEALTDSSEAQARCVAMFVESLAIEGYGAPVAANEPEPETEPPATAEAEPPRDAGD